MKDLMLPEIFLSSKSYLSTRYAYKGVLILPYQHVSSLEVHGGTPLRYYISRAASDSIHDHHGAYHYFEHVCVRSQWNLDVLSGRDISRPLH